MSSLSRLGAVMRKEALQMRRDRLTFAMILGIPLMQILLFGYAINTDVRNITTAIADEANTHRSREFVAQLEQTQVTKITQRVNTAAELETLLRAGQISIGVAIPPDFDRRIIDTDRAAVHILVDGSDPTMASQWTALRACSSRSVRPTPPPRDNTAGPVSASPSANA
jgi:ABC-2 type transport system permease protein